MADLSQRSIYSGRNVMLKLWWRIDLCLFAGEDFDIDSRDVLLKIQRHREQTVDTAGEGEGRTNWESITDMYTLSSVKWIASRKLL